MSQQINLFNPIFRQQKKYFSSVTMLQALGVIGLACVLLAGDAMMRARSLEQQAAAVDKHLLGRQNKLTEYKTQYPPRQKSPTLATEIGAAEAELKMLAAAAATLQQGGFGDTRGFSEYFRAFSRAGVEGLWLTEVRVGAGAQLGVKGRTLEAELVPAYIRRLAQEPIMRGSSFASLDIERPVSQPGALGGGTPTFLEFNLQSAVAAPAGAPQ